MGPWRNLEHRHWSSALKLDRNEGALPPGSVRWNEGEAGRAGEGAAAMGHGLKS